jgi:dolichol-phosphate mannosyltransferase
MSSHKSFCVVIPIFNERECLPELLNRLGLVFEKFSARGVTSSVLFVDDGSSDNSLEILKVAAENLSWVNYASLSRNFGHQIAVTAGLDISTADVVGVMDADLQDPPEALVDLFEEIARGSDVAHARRRQRMGETRFKLFTATLFYRGLASISEIDLPKDVGDFRVMTRRVVDAFKCMPERDRYIRGMIPWIGFEQSIVEYDRDERFAGETKYPLWKMLKLALTATTSFSTKPLLLVTRVGFLVTALGFIGAFFLVVQKVFLDTVVPGFTTITVLIALFSGVQILSMGVVGVYIGKIFDQVKARPTYFLSEVNVDRETKDS